MYIDPNTGGVLFQALAGAFAAISGGLLFSHATIANGWRAWAVLAAGNVE